MDSDFQTESIVICGMKLSNLRCLPFLDISKVRKLPRKFCCCHAAFAFSLDWVQVLRNELTYLSLDMVLKWFSVKLERESCWCWSWDLREFILCLSACECECVCAFFSTCTNAIWILLFVQLMVHGIFTCVYITQAQAHSRAHVPAANAVAYISNSLISFYVTYNDKMLLTHEFLTCIQCVSAVKWTNE